MKWHIAKIEGHWEVRHDNGYRAWGWLSFEPAMLYVKYFIDRT